MDTHTPLSSFELLEAPMLDFDELVVRTMSTGSDGFGRSSSAPSRTSSLIPAAMTVEKSNSEPKGSPKNPLHASFDGSDHPFLPSLAQGLRPPTSLRPLAPLVYSAPDLTPDNAAGWSPFRPAQRHALPEPLGSGDAKDAHGDHEPAGLCFGEWRTTATHSGVRVASPREGRLRSREVAEVPVHRTSDPSYGTFGKLQSSWDSSESDEEDSEYALLCVSDALEDSKARRKASMAARNAFVRSVGGDLMR
eukprot:CAMPEP_0174928850 /NCGR_PEP_ID=MMETSP1355-20121228/26449_1 /TAXON_ID=464990 /ORGANISM="Hemiselmis tepida, Strain CCMP443" /LENGTH=248 /DNA_ID=CAMNT_0016175029 /DNA_START=61 /DNA_END=807 /DNA_ORIENTATION=+